MNKTEFIDAMLDAGMTPQDIFDLAQARTKNNAELLEARADFINALIEYVYVINPKIEIDDEDIKDIENALIEQERRIRNYKTPAATKKLTEDEIIKMFLKNLGI